MWTFVDYLAVLARAPLTFTGDALARVSPSGLYVSASFEMKIRCLMPHEEIKIEIYLWKNCRQARWKRDTISFITRASRIPPGCDSIRRRIFFFFSTVVAEPDERCDFYDEPPERGARVKKNVCNIIFGFHASPTGQLASSSRVITYVKRYTALE